MYDIFDKILAEKGLTAYKVSKSTGVSTATLTAWKKGDYVPKPDKMKKIAEFLGVSEDYLRTGIEPSFGTETDLIVGFMNNPELKETMRKLSALKDTDKQLVISLINSLYEKVEE